MNDNTKIVLAYIILPSIRFEWNVFIKIYKFLEKRYVEKQFVLKFKLLHAYNHSTKIIKILKVLFSF